MDKILQKLNQFLRFVVVFFVSLYDKAQSAYRKRKLKKLAEEERADNIDLPKTEYVFRKYMSDSEINTTDDIAEFFTTGVGKELVEKTNGPIKPPSTRRPQRPERYNSEFWKRFAKREQDDNGLSEMKRQVEKAKELGTLKYMRTEDE